MNNIPCKQRWVLYYDGACPLCFRSQKKIKTMLPNVKLTVVDLQSSIARNKNYSTNELVLETKDRTYFGADVVLKLLSETKYKFLTSKYIKWFALWVFKLISNNKKVLNKMINYV